ncbi:hypothetical protein K3G63_21310 [Hymenobacter sp. HSC-4F20]|uniref:hypothetical protein n=1 Tax=Hymenobacter sp. HSC-4F20 TaxID=2864135 RepID=UPI001C72DB05|nr:hypothetical protein [Hymenobacter sp. HSC-4F20]MBX0292996.1 hypothetical protein [Hymenobacter sp. HSC-4F20]
MRYNNLLPLCGALLVIHMGLQGPELLAAWMLVGVSSAFWWKSPGFLRAVVVSEILIALGYGLLISGRPQLLWLTRNSSLPSLAWLAIPMVFNLLSSCICVGIPYAITTRLRRWRRSPKVSGKEPAYAAPRHLSKQAV